MDTNLYAVAAATLVQTLFNNSSALRDTLNKKVSLQPPQVAADFLKPYYEAMLALVKAIPTTP